MAQVDLQALAAYALDVLDCSELYEDDEFAFTFQDVRIYCQRKRTMFVLHVDAQRIRIPRH